MNSSKMNKKSKTNATEMKNFLNILKPTPVSKKTVGENKENKPPTEMKTPRRLFNSRIPVKSPPVEDDFNFQKSGHLMHRSTPNTIRSPRAASTGRITARAAPSKTAAVTIPNPRREIGILEATSPPNSPLFKNYPKLKTQAIEQSPFMRCKSKSLRGTPTSVKAKTQNFSTSTPNSSSSRSHCKSNLKTSVIEQSPFSRCKSKSVRNTSTSANAKTPNFSTSTPNSSNSSSDYKFNRSYSYRSGILRPINESANQTTPSKSSVQKKAVNSASLKKGSGGTSSEAGREREAKTGKCDSFTQELKNILSELREVREAFTKAFSVSKLLK